MTNFIKKASITAVTALTILGSSIAIANSYITEYVYYATSAKTTIVGERIERCNGSVYTTGQVTPYKKLTGREPCNWM